MRSDVFDGPPLMNRLLATAEAERDAARAEARRLQAVVDRVTALLGQLACTLCREPSGGLWECTRCAVAEDAGFVRRQDV